MSRAWRFGSLPVTEVPAEEWDGLREFGMRLECPGGHGPQVVVGRRGAGEGEVFALACGCSRGRRIGGPRTETEKGAAEVSADSVVIGGEEPALAEGEEPADMEPAGRASEEEKLS